MRAETVTAIAATVAAVAAVMIAAWDNVQSREHNRLSVAPRLTVDMTRSNRTTTFWVRNDGIGPAMVQRLVVRYNDPEQRSDTSSWGPVARVFADEGHRVTGMWEFNRGDAIGVDREFNLLRVEAADSGATATVDSLIGLVSIAIDYESIYGDSTRETFNWPE